MHPLTGNSTGPGEGGAPLVTAIVPAYNAQTTIIRALNSIAAQTYRPIEIIVVDDASDDQTYDVARSFSAGGIATTVCRLERNEGASQARNHAIERAAGAFVAFLDADDEWQPEKLQTQMRVFRENPSLAFVYSEAAFVGPGEKDLGLVNPGRIRPDGKDAWKVLLLYPTATTPTVLARTDLVRRVGGFDRALTIAEDQDLWIRLALEGEIRCVNKPLSRVHDRHDSLSNLNRLKSKVATLPMVLKHLSLLHHRLTPQETRKILSERFAAVGRHFYEAGETLEGLSYLARSVFQGAPVSQTLKYILAASPAARVAKRFLPGRPHLANSASLARFPPDCPPMLTVVIDTEEEFDWSTPFDPKGRDVQAIRHLHRLQSVFEKHGVIPTYVVDYAIVDSDAGVEVLKPLVETGRAMVGAHLHPWVNPPFGEAEETRNTYPGNLPFKLEYGKLSALTAHIEERLGMRPRIYRAGRYGYGPSTIKALQSLGYEVDTSILPSTDLRPFAGPDFTDFTNSPFWLGENLGIFEIPLTRGYSGALRNIGPALAPLVYTPRATRFRLPGIMARLGLLERGTLTPEGMTLPEMTRLTRTMIKDGTRLFGMSLHSSTVLPWEKNLYVTDESTLAAFLKRIDDFLTAFRAEFGGRFVTPIEARDIANNSRTVETSSAAHHHSESRTAIA
jgi:glycosyltransferase involved in cell wall biosynthesis